MTGKVITGLALATPLGDAAATWSALRAGRTAISALDRFDADGLSVAAAAAIGWLDSLPTQPCRSFAITTRIAAEALESAGLAGAEAGIPIVFAAPPLEPDLLDRLQRLDDARQGIASDPQVLVRMRRSGNHDWTDLFPDADLTLLNTACASGISAVIEACELLDLGLCERVLVLAVCTAVDREAMLRFAQLGALSRSSAAAATVSRPFSLGRDGFVMGEAAAGMVIETESAARRRAVPIRARILGYAETTDRQHLTRADSSAVAASSCMAQALQMAGLTPGQIGHINAHGTSTIENDRAEYAALATVFGDWLKQVPIVATKSQLGHSLAASGAVDAILAIRSLEERWVLPTLNHDPDPEIPLRILGGQGANRGTGAALCNAFGFGGQNACLVLAEGEP